MSALPSWRLNAQLFTALEQTTSTIGVFVRDVNGRATVNIGDGTITGIRYATRYRPRKGEGVILTFYGNTVRITGPTVSHDNQGTITAVDAAHGVVTVLCDAKHYTLPYTQSYENESNTSGGLGPLVGDLVSINWDGVSYVIDRLTAATVDPDVPPLTSNQRNFTKVFYPTQSGSYVTARSRWSGTKADLYCDSTHQAAFFYGNTVKTTLRNAAWIDSVEVYLSLRTKSGAEPTIGRHYDGSEQSGGVSLSDGAVRGWKGWVPLPVAWAEDWRAAVGGVALTGGESVYRGIGTDHQAGKLRIRGRQ